jgi:hypothetical protein
MTAARILFPLAIIAGSAVVFALDSPPLGLAVAVPLLWLSCALRSEPDPQSRKEEF